MKWQARKDQNRLLAPANGEKESVSCKKKEHQGNKEYMHKWSSGPLALCTCRYTNRNSFPHTCIWIFRPSQLFLLFSDFLSLSIVDDRGVDRCAVCICIYIILHEFCLSLSLPNEFSVCLSIMSCELLSISLSWSFHYWSWFVSFFWDLRFQSNSAHARTLARQTWNFFSSVYEICIFNKLNRIQKPTNRITFKFK